jgi:hypothetical protein
MDEQHHRGRDTAIAVPPTVRHIPEVWNRSDVHRAGAPAVGRIANARSTATFSRSSLRAPAEARALALGGSSAQPRPDFDPPDKTYGQKMPVGVGGLWIAAPGVVADGGLLRPPSGQWRGLRLKRGPAP